MCTVNAQSGLLKAESTTVRLAMKLPRYGQWGNNVNQVNPETNSHIRKVQSASAARGSRTSSPIKTGKNGSHFEPLNQTTQGLPIPNHGGRQSMSRSVDKSDLTRMYDYATWNMYERIVSARRMRLANQIESSTQRDCGASAGGGATGDREPQIAKSKSNAQPMPTSKPATLFSNSQDEGTLDETDKSSTASTLTDSSVGAYGLGLSPPEGGSEDHFIFQLDM